MQEKLNQQTQARDLYFGAEHTQKQIADKVGVSERTIYGWIKDNAWNKMREAAYAAPVVINQNICNQIICLQNVIARRPLDEQYPTKSEAETISKLILCMERLKKFPTLSHNIHMMQSFINTFIGHDQQTAEKVTTYADQYFKGKTENDFEPWHMEYQIEQMLDQRFARSEAAKRTQQEAQNTENQYNYTEKANPLAAEAFGEGGGSEPEVSRNFPQENTALTTEHDQKMTVIARNEATSRNTDEASQPSQIHATTTRNKPEVSRNFEGESLAFAPSQIDGSLQGQGKLAAEASHKLEAPITTEIRYTNGIPWKYYMKNGEVHDIAYAYDGQDEELHLLQLHLEREGHYGIDESSDPANPIINSLCGVDGGRYRKCKTQNGEIVELGDFISEDVIKAIDNPGKRIWLSELKRVG